jgi:hypothetical protein
MSKTTASRSHLWNHPSRRPTEEPTAAEKARAGLIGKQRDEKQELLEKHQAQSAALQRDHGYQRGRERTGTGVAPDMERKQAAEKKDLLQRHQRARDALAARHRTETEKMRERAMP